MMPRFAAILLVLAVVGPDGGTNGAGPVWLYWLRPAALVLASGLIPAFVVWIIFAGKSSAIRKGKRHTNNTPGRNPTTSAFSPRGFTTEK